MKKVSSSTENIRVKIISSLQNCDITIDGSNEPGKEFISIWFNGARIMTLNEMLRTIQVQKYELFRYKKEWQKLMSRAILMLPKEKDLFLKMNAPLHYLGQGKDLLI